MHSLVNVEGVVRSSDDAVEFPLPERAINLDNSRDDVMSYFSYFCINHMYLLIYEPW